MKLNCSRSALDHALGVLTGVVSSRTPREALKCAQIVALKDHITLAGTDLEVSVRCVVSQVEVSKEGEALVPADKLSQIVRELSDDVLGIETTEEAIHIRGEGSHFQIYGQDPSEFPPIAEFTGEADLVVAAGVLRRLIESTVFAAARENTRYAINGVLWEKKGKKLQLVATDGRRLAKAGGSVKKSSDGDVSVIVPSKTMTLLMRMTQGDVEQEVHIKASANQLLVRVGAMMVASILVEGHFPKYDDVIPKDNPNKVTFKTSELHGAIRRAALLTSDESKGIRMDFGKDKLVLSSRAPQQGEATVDLPVEYSGKPTAMGFNPTFLNDALRVVEADQVALEFSEPAKPGVLSAGKDFVYVIMPVSLA
ncbi:MAG: DNA polymerase III subunit beta [Phycisphaerae bacterium]|nr:DNA polymerase III subunit beta [Phycisphaerae bacterium]